VAGSDPDEPSQIGIERLRDGRSDGAGSIPDCAPWLETASVGTPALPPASGARTEASSARGDIDYLRYPSYAVATWSVVTR
jgi:hypothetical protein